MGEKAITPETVVDLGLSTESDAELTWILINYTSGGAKEIVRLYSDASGLEAWRNLSREYDPKTGASGVQAMKALISPDRAKNYGEFSKHLKKWDFILTTEVKRGGPAAEVCDPVKATAMLSMPKVLEQECFKRGAGFLKDYHAVRKFADEMVHLHVSEGIEPTLFHAETEEPEEDDVEIMDQEGNSIIGSIVSKNGKKVFQHRGGKQTGGGANREKKVSRRRGNRIFERLCFRCQRPGHIRANCTQTHRADGELIRMPMNTTARPEGIHEVSEGNQEVVMQSIEIGLLEIEGRKAAPGPNNRYFSLTEESSEEEDFEEEDEQESLESLSCHVCGCDMVCSMGCETHLHDSGTPTIIPGSASFLEQIRRIQPQANVTDSNVAQAKTERILEPNTTEDVNKKIRQCVAREVAAALRGVKEEVRLEEPPEEQAERRTQLENGEKLEEPPEEQEDRRTPPEDGEEERASKRYGGG